MPTPRHIIHGWQRALTDAEPSIMDIAVPTKFRPMLAETVPADGLGALRYPLLASPKIDGIRAVIHGGRLLSRSLKPIRNTHVRETLERLADGFPFDGELFAVPEGRTLAEGHPAFQDVTSAIMSGAGRPDFMFCVFDMIPADNILPFEVRLRGARERVGAIGDPRLVVVPHVEVRTPDGLLAIEEAWLAEGWEGVMLRDPQGPYKFNRSTLREGYLLKLKRFDEIDADVVGFEERYHNDNEATTDERGFTKRSHAQAGRRPAGTLGALILVAPGQAQFSCGTGFTDAQRKDIWENRGAYLGARVKIKYQRVGTKDAPRIPVFVAFRDRDDTSP